MRMMRRNSKKTKPVSWTTIEAIPNEILTEVLVRVAATSVTDISNVKLSCKSLSEIAEDKLVYQNVSLDKFSVASWRPLSRKEQAFLTRCLECQNPEQLYRQAVVDYFNKGRSDSAYINLEKAAKLGHLGALYLKCIVLLLNDDLELRKIGIKLLGHMTKSNYGKRKLRSNRNNLINMLQIMWVDHPRLRGRRPIFCNEEVNHNARIGWDGEMESTQCEACNADNELRFICNYLPE